MTATGKKKKIFDNRYEILSIIGRGSRGVVYRARQIKNAADNDIALKVLMGKKGEGPPAELLRKEALAMISCRHKYVIRLDDFHSMGDLCYLAMELAEKGDLRQYAKNLKGRIGLTQGELFMLQAAEGLEFVHRAGILHRDIKPDNLLVIDDRNIRIADFGVALLPGEDASLEELQKGVGSLDYMAPEVLEGERYDKRSDLYALGMTFYEMLSGVHPLDEIPLAQQIEARQDKNIPHLKKLLPNAPDRVCDAVMRAIAFDPDSRFNTSLELIERLLDRESQPKAQSAKSTPAAEQRTETAETKPVKKPVLRSKISSGESDKKLPGRLQERLKSKSERSSSQSDQPSSAPEPARESSARPAPGRLRLKPKANDSSDQGGQENRDKKSSKPVLRQRSLKNNQGDAGKADHRKPENANKAAPQTKSTPPPERDKPTANAANSNRPKDTARAAPADSTDNEPKPIKTTQPDQQPSEDTPLDSAETQPEGDNQEVITAAPVKQQAPKAGKADLANQMKEMVERQLENSKKSSRGPMQRDEPVAQEQRSKSDDIIEVEDENGSVSITSSKQEKASKKAKKSLLLETPAARSSHLPKIAALVVLLAVGYFYFSPFGSNDEPGQILPDQTASSLEQPQHVLPPVADEPLNFPHLPTGLYVGSIEGLFPGERTALSFFAHRNKGELYMLLGIPGWTPQPVPLPDPETGTYQVRVSANGIILDLTGEEVGGAILGVYQNALSGQEGEWRVEPVR